MLKLAKKSFELTKLLEAKDLSDKRQYTAKNRILADLVNANPKNFFIDSELNSRYVGLTHKPTGFKIHTHKKILPPQIEKRSALLDVDKDDSIFDLVIKAAMFKSL
jgi:hypothetical protein